MAKVDTVKQKEGFIVQMGGDYNLPFDEVEVTGTFEAGTVLENPSKAVNSTSAEVLGILAEPTEGTQSARVMVRGNPTTVNAQELVYGAANQNTINDMLEAVGIVVTNK